MILSILNSDLCTEPLAQYVVYDYSGFKCVYIWFNFRYIDYKNYFKNISQVWKIRNSSHLQCTLLNVFNFSKFLFFFFNLRYIFSYSVWILSKSSSNFCVMLLTSKMSPLSGHASYNGKMSLCEKNNVGINIMLFLANSCSTLKHQVD